MHGDACAEIQKLGLLVDCAGDVGVGVGVSPVQQVRLYGFDAGDVLFLHVFVLFVMLSQRHSPPYYYIGHFADSFNTRINARAHKKTRTHA